MNLEDMDFFVHWFSENLHAKRGELCDTLFGEGKIQLRELRLENYFRESGLELRLEKNANFNSRYSSGKDYVRFPLSSAEPDASEVYRMVQYLTWKIVIDDLGAPLYPPQNALSAVPSGETLYLPAARTGFTLMRKMLASAAFTMGGEAMPLLLPTRRFMQRFLNLSFEGKSRYADFADILESRVLLGQVRWNNAPLPDYSYFPMKNHDVGLPLWLTSSLVTELSPLLLFLRGGDDFRSLVIEEPEAHLHLEMQKELARLLVRLVNSGLPVCITTHGDTFFQQMSNLVK
ncbi:MAG TPA: AAA family ATPase, partial [Synergistaceae bacterium]|nr:AAA family ATPase [Synergistaceae bacterium]